MALVRGKEVKEGPKQLPKNEKLWNMVVMQAKSRFNKYPSPAAAHWVRAKYTSLGGQMVDHEKQKDPRMIDQRQRILDKQESLKKQQVRKPVKKVVKKRLNQIP